MKRIGIIGGMGQWATIDILDRMLHVSVNFPIPQVIRQWILEW